MKKGIVFAIVLLLLGVNAYAAPGDLTVGGAALMSTATITGNATVNGKVSIGTTTAPVTTLDVGDYQFVTFGQVGIFLKNNAYIVSAPLSIGEAKNVNGVIYTRAHSYTDSGWVAGTSASCCSAPGIYYTCYIATTNTTGVIVKNNSGDIVAEAKW